LYRLKTLGIFICIGYLLSCNGNHHALNTKKANDSAKQKTIDSQMALDERPDSEQEGPTFAEVKADYLASYNKIERIDTLIVDGTDSIHIHTKYYCLHDSTLVIPKKYNWGEKNAKDFVTHDFASKILILDNRDTIFNKVIKKEDFNNAIYEQLKKYAILFSPDFKYNKTNQEFSFAYSISIPLTDVGVPASLVVNKKGLSKILDEYNKVE
jgi:hypothetical protein